MGDLVVSNKYSIRRSLLTVNVIGFLFSMYAHHVSVSKKTQENYRALCDLSERMNCSKIFTSRHSVGFGIMDYFVDESSILNQSNSVYGMLHYGLFFLLCFSDCKLVCKLQLVLAALSNVGSIHLAVLLIYMNDFCIVCAIAYIVNALNLFLIYRKFSFLNNTTKVNKTK